MRKQIALIGLHEISFIENAHLQDGIERWILLTKEQFEIIYNKVNKGESYQIETDYGFSLESFMEDDIVYFHYSWRGKKFPHLIIALDSFDTVYMRRNDVGSLVPLKSPERLKKKSRKSIVFR
jgi:hypothetical protein